MAKVDLKDAYFMLPIREEVSVPQIFVPEPNLPVRVPAIWPRMRPLGLHQDPEARRCPAQTAGCATDRRHRRHAHPGGVQGVGSGSCNRPRIPSGESGLCDKQGQLEPMQTIEVLGFSVNSLSRELSLPAAKIKKIRAETCTLLASSQGVPIRKLSQLLVKLEPAARAVH